MNLEAGGDEGRLLVGLADKGNLRWVAADVGWPLEEARRRLDLSPIAAVGLGRSLTAAVLIQRILLKVPSMLLLEVEGDGPLGKMIAEADATGGIRGLVGEPRVPTPEDGRMAIGAAVGRGILRVTRVDRGRRYAGQVELVSGELSTDVAHYLEQSEQIRSAVLLGVLPRPSGIAAAGGIVVEALPGTPDDVIERVEENIQALEGVSASLDRGGPTFLLEAVLEGLEPEIVERRPLEYRCGCNRESLLERLLPIAAEDLDALVGDDGVCEAVCAFCGEKYVYGAEELSVGN